MVKKISLLDQVYAYEKHQSLDRIKGDVSKMDMSRILEQLLPNYDQQEKPRLFHRASQLHKGLRGGVRSGKTFSLEAEAIGLSYLNRPYYHLSVSPSFDLACVTVVPTLEQLCEENNLSYEWSKSNNLFRIFWGTKKKDIANILIFGADANFKGITAASGDLNEPFSIAKEKFLVWWERISHPKAVRMARIWGGTAEPEKMTWGHEYYKMSSTKDIYLGTITTYDNKFLSKEYIKGLEDKYDPKMRRVYMLGENVNLSANAAYYNFETTVHVLPFQPTIQRLLKKTRLQVLITMDFNINPMCAGEQIIDEDALQLYQVDEYKINNSNTRELAQLVIHRIVNRYNLVNTFFVITGDPAGRQGDTRSLERTTNDYTIFKEEIDRYNALLPDGKPKIRYSFSVAGKAPFVFDRITMVNNVLYKRQFFITDNCVFSIEDRGLVVWKPGADGFHLDKSKKNTSGETTTHLSDANDYGIWLWLTKMIAHQVQEASGIPEIYTETSTRW